jgi:hypothetical protein
VNPKSDSLVSFLPWTTIFGLIYLASIAALARRHYVLRADKLLQLDDRRPIIFLRSFADDNVRLWGKGIVGKLRRRTIDEAIRSVCEQIGPFVAIASPKTKLPRLGAAQVYFSDDTWQSAIARWVAMAELIVMVAGRTEGLRWELEHILSNKERTKLMVILPPAMRKSIKITSEWFREYFCRTIYAEGLSTMDLKLKQSESCFLMTGYLLSKLNASTSERSIILWRCRQPSLQQSRETGRLGDGTGRNLSESCRSYTRRSSYQHCSCGAAGGADSVAPREGEAGETKRQQSP